MDDIDKNHNDIRDHVRNSKKSDIKYFQVTEFKIVLSA